MLHSLYCLWSSCHWCVICSTIKFISKYSIICLAIDNLRKRKVWLLDWCYMCKCNGESVDHLFLHCSVAMDLWAMVFGLFGVSWVMPQSVMGLLACWQGSFGRHRNGYIWLMVPHCLLWCLWRERNSRCFEDKERSISDLKLFILRTLMDWLAALRNQSFSSFLDFLDSCNFCSWLFWPLVHSLCTRVFHFLEINKLLLIKKKKKIFLEGKSNLMI